MMRRALEVAIACLLAAGPLYAQQIGIPVKRGVITVDSAPSGDCSAVPGQVRQIRGTRETYVCEGGTWVRKDLPVCDPDPPSGTCSGYAVCMSTAGSLYVCASGSWVAVGGGSGSGDMEQSTYDPDSDGTVETADVALNADMKRSVYDTDTDSTVDAAEGLAEISAWSVRYEDRDTDGDGTPDLRIVGDYDGDGTLEWIDDVAQAFTDFCAPTDGTVTCGSWSICESSGTQRTLGRDVNGDGTANDPYCGTVVVLPGIYKTAVGERAWQIPWRGWRLLGYGVFADMSDMTCSELYHGDGSSHSTDGFIGVRAVDTNGDGTVDDPDDTDLLPIEIAGFTFIGYGTRPDLDPDCRMPPDPGTESCEDGNWCPATYMNGIYIEQMNQATIRDVNVFNIDRQGINVMLTRKVRLENVHVDGAGEHCASAARSGDVVVSGLTLNRCGDINDERGAGFVWIEADSTRGPADLHNIHIEDVSITNSWNGLQTEGLGDSDPGVLVRIEGLHCDNIEADCIILNPSTQSTGEGLRDVVLRDIVSRDTTGSAEGGAIMLNVASSDPVTVLSRVTLDNVTIDNIGYGEDGASSALAIEADEVFLNNVRIDATNGAFSGTSSGLLQITRAGRIVAHDVEVKAVGDGINGIRIVDADGNPDVDMVELRDTRVVLDDDPTSCLYMRPSTHWDSVLLDGFSCEEADLDGDGTWKGLTYCALIDEVDRLTIRNSQFRWFSRYSDCLDIRTVDWADISGNYFETDESSGYNANNTAIHFKEATKAFVHGNILAGEASYVESDDSGATISLLGNTEQNPDSTLKPWEKYTGTLSFVTRPAEHVLSFMRANVTAGNGGTYLLTEFDAYGGTRYPALWDARLKSLTCWSKADITAGSITFKVKEYGGSDSDLSVTIDASGGTVSAYTAVTDESCTTNCTFDVGDPIAVYYTSDSGLLPDGSAEVFCELTVEVY